METLLAFCVGNSPVTGEFPAKRLVTRGFDVFLDLPLNKRFSKQSWESWSETPSRSLWRHCKESPFTRTTIQSNTFICVRWLRWFITFWLLWWQPPVTYAHLKWSFVLAGTSQSLVAYIIHRRPSYCGLTPWFKWQNMWTPWHENTCCITGPFVRGIQCRPVDSTPTDGFQYQRASNVEFWCSRWCYPEHV